MTQLRVIFFRGRMKFTGPPIGDTVAASSSLLNLKQKGTPIADTVLKKNLLRQWRQKWPSIGDTVDIFF